ncbi:MAG: glycosyltransferase family 9 protein, partial [Ignavibacteria bacterium]
AGNVWNTKKCTELASRLAINFNAYIFISEGPADGKYVSEMESVLKHKYNLKETVRHCGVLMNNTALISMLDLFITNDTGIMHLAAGLSVPMTALFGPTNAYEWGPIGENKISVQSSTQDINEISVEKVYEVCEAMLSKRKN